MVDRLLVTVGSVFGMLAVVAGAFGAHALKGRLPEEKLAWFETGARYQVYHALALVLAGLLAAHGLPARLAGWLFVAGILVFSGTLYLMAFGGPRWLGAITPVGGVCLIAGWAALAWSALAGRP
ncbi:MAG: DUF423 domain-containing protein [Acidobacteria bacterium]|nr:DUF423 domain-containing protein [Acidobacteriota bacterium]